MCTSDTNASPTVRTAADGQIQRHVQESPPPSLIDLTGYPHPPGLWSQHINPQGQKDTDNRQGQKDTDNRHRATHTSDLCESEV